MFEGIGFAIPSADAQPVVEDLIAYGYVKDRVALGVMVIALSPVTGPANDLPSQGLYISSVEDYSDLNNHDITVGDVILTADGVTLETTSDLLDVLETHKPGETVRLEIQKREMCIRDRADADGIQRAFHRADQPHDHAAAPHFGRRERCV